MLKIKDNIDLKELEKFGYYKASMYGQPSYNKDLEYDNDTISVIIDTRKLFLDTWGCINDKYLLKVVDDLIKADLVEKVDSNER